MGYLGGSEHPASIGVQAGWVPGGFSEIARLSGLAVPSSLRLEVSRPAQGHLTGEWAPGSDLLDRVGLTDLGFIPCLRTLCDSARLVIPVSTDSVPGMALACTW